MDAPELTPAVRRARDFLLDLVRRNEQQGVKRLPTVGDLARQGHFSPATLVKAIRALRGQGILRASQRGGIHVSASPDAAGSAPAPAPEAGGPAWRRVKDQVAAGMVAGAYPPGAQLPSVKELCQRCGASFATVRKALQSLVAAGRLVRFKRGYRAFEPRASASHASLVLIAHSETIGDIGTVIPRHPEFLRTLERECLRLNVRLVVRDEQEVTAPGSGRSSIPIGCIVWNRAIAFNRLCDLLRALERTGRPVAVMDENGDMPLQPVIRPNPLARIFLVASSMSAGVALGNHLLAAGHRRIGYLTPVGKALYCRNRYDGLARAFESAGLKDSVVRFAPDRYSSFEEIVAGCASRRPFRSFIDHVARFSAAIGGSAAADKFYGFYTDTYLLRRAMQAHLLPMLDKAVCDRSLTALVGVNDWTALVAMAHARQAGVAVPGQMAFAGFDDTFEAFSHGLTSYDYNMPALVHAMLDHILAHPSSRRHEALPPLEIPGIVRSRRSTEPGSRGAGAGGP